MSAPLRPDEDPTDARVWKLLDQHPHLKSDPSFARRVAEAAALESASAPSGALRATSAERAVRPLRTRGGALLFLGSALAAAALVFLWVRSGTDSGSGDAPALAPLPPELSAQIESPSEELLLELDLLRNLDLLEGGDPARDLAVLLDLSDLELLDRARALWEEEVEGGD